MTAGDFSYSCTALVAHGYHFKLDTVFATDSVLEETLDTPPASTTTTTGLGVCRSIKAEKGLDKCPADAAICQVSQVKEGSATVTSAVKPFALAKNIPTEKDVVVQPNGKGFDLVLRGGEWGKLQLSTNMTFSCDQNIAKPIVRISSRTTESTLVLEWITQDACGLKNGSVGSGTPGMSGSGLFFLFVFLSIFFYVTIGSAFNILVKRINRFPDFLPNYVFWESLISRVTRGGRYVRI
ncbi:autophagy-related protein 27 [Obelidium mucronatum]|nr:autophagy-related protein 27 [Obelidium mucronatum]